MRLLPCLAALVLAAAPLTTHIADACGGYEMIQRAPQALAVSRHTSYSTTNGVHAATTRSFAVLGRDIEAAEGAKWTGVAARSYDSARITSLGRLASPMTVTLVGSHGPRVVKAQRHVALGYSMLDFDTTFDAIELPLRRNEEIAVALVGDHSDATWHRIDYRYTAAQKIHDTDLEFTPTFTTGTARFSLKSGDRDLGTYDGNATGAVDIAGVRYIVATHLGTARLIRV